MLKRFLEKSVPISDVLKTLEQKTHSIEDERDESGKKSKSPPEDTVLREFVAGFLDSKTAKVQTVVENEKSKKKGDKKDSKEDSKEDSKGEKDDGEKKEEGEGDESDEPMVEVVEEGK